MVFRVPISFAHCNGVSTLKGACMNQIEREEGKEKRGTGEKRGGKGGREGDVGEKEGGEQREGEQREGGRRAERRGRKRINSYVLYTVAQVHYVPFS